MPENPEHYSILRGADAIVDRFFGVEEDGKLARYATRTTYLKGELHPLADNAAAMLSALYSQIELNWRQRCYRKEASAENWRCEGATHYDESRSGWEVILEREIIKAMGSQTWHNNVPTSSGLCSPSHDKARNIDLVQAELPSAYTFYELKWDADTPIFAAIEIVYRGILNVFTRLHRVEVGYSSTEMPMLRVPFIHLRVLAPAEYYENPTMELGWLEDKLNQGLNEFLSLHPTAAVAMDFMFEAFPAGFSPPFGSSEAIRRAVSDKNPVCKGRRA